MVKKDSPSNKRLRPGSVKQDNSVGSKSQLSNQAHQHPTAKAMSNADSEPQTKRGPASQRTSRAKKRSQAATSDQDSDKAIFPIVGIGASAGGLESFSELLRETPKETGMAFVLVQHLDPKHKSMLTTLLSRTTAMPVIEATDQLTVQPDHIYVIPPDSNLGILHGKLQLLRRGNGHKQHMPINYFMRSLAQDRGTQAIGVILSGTASDGALGLKAIKAEGGITLAQDPESAKYDGMPRSAIAAGCVDFVLSLVFTYINRTIPKSLGGAVRCSGRCAFPGPWRKTFSIFICSRSYQ